MILVTQDTHGADYLETQEGRNLPVLHCIKGDEGWELNSRVKEALEASDCIVQYFQKNTFGSKEMVLNLWNQEVYEDLGVEEIELVGLCTDICVISNAMLMKAFFREVPISVDASCCAGVTPATHENALIAMRCCQIIINHWEDQE